MKNYIKKNLTPIVFGFAIGVIVCNLIDTTESIILKIELIRSEK